VCPPEVRFDGIEEGTGCMIVIGADTHKQTHTVVAVDGATGRQLGQLTFSSRPEGALEALLWAADLDPGSGRVWAIEDVRHVSGRLERELIRHGQAVIRVPPRLMAGARPAGRLRGKSDPIDAAAVALAAVRAGIDTLPVARLEGADLDLRRLLDRREDLVAERTREINRLRWALHDMHCPVEVPARAMDRIGWTTKLKAWTARQTSVQGRIAHETLLRIRALTRDIHVYERELDRLAREHASVLIDNLIGCGPLTAAKIIGETAGIDRFRSEPCYARAAGTAPVPVSSGRRDRHRLDRGGNRQLNLAFHRIAIYQARACPQARAFLERKQADGKTRREALRCLKRHITRRAYTLLMHTHTTSGNAPAPALALT
jgi:transposase